MSYSTVANIKAYLGIESDNTTDDLLLTSLLSQVESIINTKTGNVFEPVEMTRFYDRECIEGYTLYLDDYLQSVITLTNGDGVEITSDYFLLLPRNAEAYTEIRLKTTSNGWSFDSIDEYISVLGEWGLFTTPPNEIVWCTNRLVTYLYRQKDNIMDLDRTIATGDGFILPATLPDDVEKILRSYRKTH